MSEAYHVLSDPDKRMIYDQYGEEHTAEKDFRDMSEAYHVLSDPDKRAEKDFRDMSEAYHVLSDPDKRVIYDQYGEEGLKTSESGGTPGGGRIPGLFS
ncbi:hypothetical protein T484DRAFT_1809859 [Baffinella frigidus]|nr:hypothetical protein T484DRAFT_1809859 [Cryptophyta sp. CCMP2293]